MFEKFKNPKIYLSIIASITLIVLSVFIITGFLGNSKADNKDNLINYGKADNNDHSAESEYSINVNSNSKYSYSSMKGGAILQAWSWSFNTIADNMEAIRDAGYTSVQTSPVQKCRIGENNNDYNLSIQKWYFQYQPVGFSIGNYQLGTEAEFKHMCDVAESYGIKIIVDTVLNHMTSSFEYIDPEYRDKSLYHTGETISDWETRYGVTKFCLSGLWDLKTENKFIQQKELEFLKQCVADGADGFRHDAAKHIELPEDGDTGSDFWPIMLDTGVEYQYGEDLGYADHVRADVYTKYMDINYDGYGEALRNGIAAGKLTTDALMNYNNKINADVENLVLWIESHDSFCTDGLQSTWMSEEQIKLGWAAVAAREKGTPIFYDRPVGGGGTTYDNRYPGLNYIGETGSDLYKDDEVVAVNIFRNEMKGENEYLRSLNSNSVFVIDRGTKGSVMINLNYTDQNINSDTCLSNGTYISHTDDESIFNVNNGRINGTIPSRGVVVLYNKGVSEVIKAGINGYASNTTNRYESEYLTLILDSYNANKATYSIDGGKSYLYDNGKTINIGWGVADKTSTTVELKAVSANGSTCRRVFTFVKKTMENAFTITFDKPYDWGDNVFAYIYDPTADASAPTSISVVKWPGIKMNKVTGNTYKVISDVKIFDKNLIIFNDLNHQSPASGKDGFEFNKYGNYNINGLTSVSTPAPTYAPTIKPSSIPTSAPTGVPSNNVKVQFKKPSDWGKNISAYVYSEASGYTSVLADWPGVAMNALENDVYEISFVNTYKDGYIIFSDGMNQIPASGSVGFGIKEDGYYTINGYQRKISDNISDAELTIYYYSTYSTPYIHYKLSNSKWTTAPGVKLTKTSTANYYCIAINATGNDNLTCCFNDGANNWDNNNGNNYTLTSTGVYTIKDGRLTNGKS